MAQLTRTEHGTPAVEDLIELSKPAQKLFFGLIKGADEYNRLDFTLKSAGKAILGTTSSPYLSKIRRELKQAGFIDKLGKYWVINPFVVAPPYSSKDPNRQWRIQQIWKRQFEDKDVYYDGIDDEYREIYET